MATPAERQRAYRERKAANVTNVTRNKRNVTAQGVGGSVGSGGRVEGVGVEGGEAKAKPPARTISKRDPKTGRFPAGEHGTRTILCPPCAPDQYALARSMMLDGVTTKQLQVATGANWHAIEEYGLSIDPDNWPAALTQWQARRSQVLGDYAQAVFTQEQPAAVTVGPMGRTEQYRTDPTMLGQLNQSLLPEIHGKLAAAKQAQAQQQAVSVTIVMGGEKRDLEPIAINVDSQDATQADNSGGDIG